MEVGPRPRADAEAASMEVVENRELRGRAAAPRCRLIEPELKIALLLETAFFPNDRGIIANLNVEG